MYGTIAKMRVKPGHEDELLAQHAQYEDLDIPGHKGGTVFRLDSDPSTYQVVVYYESREAYEANAGSPEQHARYLTMREHLTEDPVWMDGEIVQGFWRD